METSEIRRLELKAEQTRALIRTGEKKVAELSQRLEGERHRYREGMSQFAQVKRNLLVGARALEMPRAAMERLQTGTIRLAYIQRLLGQCAAGVEELTQSHKQTLWRLATHKEVLASVEDKILETQNGEKALSDEQQAEALHELHGASHGTHHAEGDEVSELMKLGRQTDLKDVDPQKTDQREAVWAPEFGAQISNPDPLQSNTSQHDLSGGHRQNQEQSFRGGNSVDHERPPNARMVVQDSSSEIVDRIRNFSVASRADACSVSFTYTGPGGAQMDLCVERMASGGVAISMNPERAHTGRYLVSQVNPLLRALRQAGVRVVTVSVGSANRMGAPQHG